MISGAKGTPYSANQAGIGRGGIRIFLRTSDIFNDHIKSQAVKGIAGPSRPIEHSQAGKPRPCMTPTVSQLV